MLKTLFSQAFCALALLTPAAQAASDTLRLEVDGRELYRQLVHARLEIPVHSGPLTLYYPKWIPGTHAPGGPIANIAGLRLETRDGAAISWRRDEEDPFQIHCTVPSGAKR